MRPTPRHRSHLDRSVRRLGLRRVAVSGLAAALLLPLATLPAQAEPTAAAAPAPAHAAASAAAPVAMQRPPSGVDADADVGVLPPASTSTVGTVRADEAWARGVTGAGVGVALIDTGVAPSTDLHADSPPQVSLAGPGRADGDGHGTFLAGLIAGRDGPDGPLGVAPDSPVWSIRVADGGGVTSPEQVLAGLELVRTHADEFGIRVVVLALGGPADAFAGPMEAALEQLWAEGLVVVVGSGNDGSLTAPGVSPYLITVGAMDDRGTPDGLDDLTVDWSGTGVGRDGRAKPDLLAPGASVVSYRSAGSVADRENPGSRVDGQFFRGTGTSMSAASTAGAAALVLQSDPDLTPDEVKGRLVAAARPIEGSHAGVLDVLAALDADASPANGHLPRIDAVDGPLGASAAEWIGRSWIDQGWVGRSWIGRSWIGRSWIGRRGSIRSG